MKINLTLSYRQEDFFSKTTALLETAHLLDSFRLTFDEEEFCLTKDDAESSRPKRVTIRIPPEEENGILPYPSSPQSAEAPQDARKNEAPSTADEQSFFYRYIVILTIYRNFDRN